ncbi:1-deoxyxylulose-5-phosphate synthase YajO [Magallana gigas]|uniref:1-deoxyxylulose-5-phosphate synthase YajO n=1 Tax=Magallana gigas TaxID=29159 RepID=UPI003340356D
MAAKRITLPGTNLNVSRVCLGCWQFNGGKDTVNWDAQTPEESKAIVDKCLEIGVNFFDTAEGYAGSEEVLGMCLEGRRQDAVIATKFGFREGPNTPPYSPQQIDEAVTRSLNKLKTNYVDLLQVHFSSFLENMEESVKELERQVSLGRIKYYGVSNFGPVNMKNFVDAGGKPVSNQIGYNLLWRSVEHEVIPSSQKYGASILAYSPLQQGLLTGKFLKVDDVPMGRRRGKLFSPESCHLARHGQEGAEKEVFEAIAKMNDICKKANVPMAKAALSWVLNQPNVPVAIVGARTPEQMVENCEIVDLPQSVIKELTEATESVKNKIGKSIDQWAHPDRCE